MEPLAILRAALPLVEPYPQGVVPVPERIPGSAFFPCGDGLWKEEGPVPFPVGGVMIVGHDYGSEKAYRAALLKGKDNVRSPLWGRTVMLLKASGIDPRTCFYTNFFMGMKALSHSSGVTPWKKDKAFIQRCQKFFMLQVAVTQPRMILTLGIEIPKLIAPLTPDLRDWENLRTIEDLDCDPMHRGVKFAGSQNACMVVGLIHPAVIEKNLERREYNGYRGQYVEEMILGAATSGMLYTDNNEDLEWCKPPLHWYRRDQPKQG